jgi:hypothetical protein
MRSGAWAETATLRGGKPWAQVRAAAHVCIGGVERVIEARRVRVRHVEAESVRPRRVRAAPARA